MIPEAAYINVFKKTLVYIYPVIYQVKLHYKIFRKICKTIKNTVKQNLYENCYNAYKSKAVAVLLLSICQNEKMFIYYFL